MSPTTSPATLPIDEEQSQGLHQTQGPHQSQPRSKARAARSGLSTLNATAVVVAGLYFGRELLVPFVLAVLLAFVLAPAVGLLQRTRIGNVPSVLIAVALALIAIAGLGAVVAHEATSLATSLPSYGATMHEKMKSLVIGGKELERFYNSVQSTLGGVAGGVAGTPAETTVAVAPAASGTASATGGGLDGSAALVIVRSVVAPLFSPLATIGVVAIFAIFVLLAREDLRDRLVRLLGRHDLHRTILAMNDATRRLSRFFVFQVLVNSGFGLFVALGLWVAGLPSPALWGILAALMRFIPFIGTIIAVVPPLLLALIVAPGWSLALIVLGLFVVTDTVISQAIEPLLYGHSTGLSPIAIVVSAAFWALLWGPVGLLLSTPLTVCLVVIGRYVEPLGFLEVILGDGPPLDPAETFYQRALEGNVKELTVQANRAIAETSLTEYYDHVAMAGLALAQADLARDALAFERLEAIHAKIEILLAALKLRPLAKRGAKTATPERPAPAGWRQDGAVLCIPGRGQLDDLTATMAMQVLQDAGFGARQESNAILGAGRGDPQRTGGVRMCCLSVLDQGSTASGILYLLRRIQRQMPDAAVVVCLWHASATSALLQTLRAEGGEESIVLSLSELLALTKAISAREPGVVLEPA